MAINIKIDSEKIGVGDLLDLEDAQNGDRPLNTIVGIIGKFLTDDKGEYLPIGEALSDIRSLNLEEFNQLTSAFMEKMKEMQSGAVPQPKGGD